MCSRCPARVVPAARVAPRVAVRRCAVREHGLQAMSREAESARGTRPLDGPRSLWLSVQARAARTRAGASSWADAAGPRLGAVGAWRLGMGARAVVATTLAVQGRASALAPSSGPGGRCFARGSGAAPRGRHRRCGGTALGEVCARVRSAGVAQWRALVRREGRVGPGVGCRGRLPTVAAGAAPSAIVSIFRVVPAPTRALPPWLGPSGKRVFALPRAGLMEARARRGAVTQLIASVPWLSTSVWHVPDCLPPLDPRPDPPACPGRVAARG